jgi:hypothetical protein
MLIAILPPSRFELLSPVMKADVHQLSYANKNCEKKNIITKSGFEPLAND